MLNLHISKKLHYFNLDVKFSIRDKVLVIQGPSGSGKTTILDCISGIKTPDVGFININDRKIFSSDNNINIKIKDRKVGYVFQHYALFPNMTVEENVLFGFKCNKFKDTQYINYITETFKIDHLKSRKPFQISGGEKQRVALARALAAKPEILLLDEPFSALDETTKSIVYEEFLDLKNRCTINIVLVTHNKEEAELFGDKIITLERGLLTTNT